MTLLDITYCIIILCVRQNMSYCLHLSLLFVVCAFLYINVHVLLLKKKKKKKKEMIHKLHTNIDMQNGLMINYPQMYVLYLLIKD